MGGNANESVDLEDDAEDKLRLREEELPLPLLEEELELLLEEEDGFLRMGVGAAAEEEEGVVVDE